MSETTSKISVRGLRKSFGSKNVLSGVDFDIEEGESLVVIGGSGTGKSVLLKCILGLITPDAGEILIDGVDILKLSPFERSRKTRQIGMLFQGAALFDSLKVWENIAFRLIYGEGKASGPSRAIAVDRLAQVGLPAEVANLSPAELSGGMQKRVALARAIAADPKILFFDEPTTGLDPITADVINRLIVDRVKAVGATAISITHDMVSARKIADEIAMLYQGRIVWRGPASDILSSGNPYVDQFVNGRAEGPIKMALKSA
ncbi:MAG TPA: ATP-binding cassette domain-containing protein [Parvularculaceae bacterium]|nr:ATP-binding cassette domain-containing protein [Parvularculaceae bacterium]HNS86265.1 ATP-binding cassette domain-containing protein [Parvularculaceae bacterium]